jgi:NTP pyrophosphatase (non-canonical NTP hydrolase)
MTLADYEQFVESKLSGSSRASTKDRVITGAMGICGEAGELMDHIKKHCYHGPGHPLLTDYVELELGDLMFYIAVEAKAMGLTLQGIMEANVAKLSSRYKAGFTPEESANRVEGRPEARQPIEQVRLCNERNASQAFRCSLPAGHFGPHLSRLGYAWYGTADSRREIDVSAKETRQPAMGDYLS